MGAPLFSASLPDGDMVLFRRLAGPAAGIVLAAGLAWAAWTPAISGWAGWLAAAAAALALAVAVGRQRQSAHQVAGLNAELSALRGLLQDCPLPAARLSAQGEVLDANPAGRALVPVLAAVCGPAAAQVQQSGRRDVLEMDVAGRTHIALFTPAAAGANVYLNDVTASRQMVADLQRERDFAQQVMATMGQGLVILDAQNRFEYVNPAAVELLGRSARELAGRTLFDVMRPDDFPHLSEAFSRQRAGQPYTYEAGLRRPDGSLVFTLITSVPLREAVQPGGAIAVITNLTERRQAEDQWRLHSASLEAAPNGVMITDRAGRILYVNPAFAAITQYTAAELLGQNPRCLKSGLHERAFYATLWSTLLAGDTWRGEAVNRRKDGGLYTQEMVIAPIRSDGDMITHFMAVTQDITLRKQAEAALRESEEKYRLLIENASDGVTLTDEAGRVVEWSVTQEQITGVGRPAVLGRPLWEVELDLVGSDRPTPEQRAARRDFVQQALTTGQVPWSQQYRHTEICRPDGLIRTVESVAYTIQTDKGWLLCGINRDVTDRRQVEAAIRQLNQDLEWRVRERTAQLETANQALEAERAQLAERVAERTADLRRVNQELTEANAELARASRAKDEFLANMSHELRTPLNTILGLAEALAEGAYGPLTADQSDSLHCVDESGRHLLALITDILDLSKIEAGRLQLQVDAVNVADVCQASLRLVREAAQKKNLAVSVVVDPAVGEVCADARRLKQMLVNLLSNACKFTPTGGRLGLEVTGEAAAGLVVFTVWDTGIGVAPEDQPRLFKPFTQLDSRLARQYSGSGLGLSLVQRMAEMHGGSVALESAVGQGSRFSLRLPWRRPETGPEAAAVEAPAPLPAAGDAWTAQRGRPPLILLADDNEANLRVLTHYLVHSHCQVVPARTGLEVLQRAAEARPDAILLDIQLPEMSGLEVARRLRTNPALAAIPIIAVTALVMAGDRERCLAAGADDYLSKPVSLKQLNRVLEANLRRAAQRMP